MMNFLIKKFRMPPNGKDTVLIASETKRREFSLFTRQEFTRLIIIIPLFLLQDCYRKPWKKICTQHCMDKLGTLINKSVWVSGAL